MSRLDDELKAALARKEPSPDFERRVLERIAHLPPRLPWWQRWLVPSPALRWATAGVAVCVMTIAGLSEYRRHQGEVAKQQVIQALQVTAQALHKTQQKLNEFNR